MNCSIQAKESLKARSACKVSTGKEKAMGQEKDYKTINKYVEEAK